MKSQKQLFSSVKQDWNTPKLFWDKLKDIWNFDLDAAASDNNHLCSRYFTAENDALYQDWKYVVFCNPPYVRGLQPKFIKKGWEETRNGSASIVVFLIPARTDTKIWHEVIFPHASEIYFIKGRLKFSESEDSAPFPSAVVVFSRSSNSRQIIGTDKDLFDF